MAALEGKTALVKCVRLYRLHRRHHWRWPRDDRHARTLSGWLRPWCADVHCRGILAVAERRSACGSIFVVSPNYIFVVPPI